MGVTASDKGGEPSGARRGGPAGPAAVHPGVAHRPASIVRREASARAGLLCGAGGLVRRHPPALFAPRQVEGWRALPAFTLRSEPSPRSLRGCVGGRG
jgi:hypothetical protein